MVICPSGAAFLKLREESEKLSQKETCSMAQGLKLLLLTSADTTQRGGGRGNYGNDEEVDNGLVGTGKGLGKVVVMRWTRMLLGNTHGIDGGQAYMGHGCKACYDTPPDGY